MTISVEALVFRKVVPVKLLNASALPTESVNPLKSNDDPAVVVSVLSVVLAGNLGKFGAGLITTDEPVPGTMFGVQFEGFVHTLLTEPFQVCANKDETLPNKRQNKNNNDLMVDDLERYKITGIYHLKVYLIYSSRSILIFR